MKKFKSILLAGAVLASTFAASAQTIEQRLIEPEKTVFAPHWFMQAQGGAAETLGEASFGDLISPTAALNIGYRFSPVFALRAGASGWQAKGSAHYDFANHIYKYNYVQANLDAMLHLTNLFCGWNPKRTLDFYAFVGVGANDRFHNDEALDIASTSGFPFRYLWDTHKWAFAGRGGLGLNIRLSDIVALNIEANANGITDRFNSKHGKDSNIDWQFNGLIGLTIKFGKGYKTIPAVYEEIIIEPEPEPAPAPAPAPKPAPVAKKAEPMTQNVFFLIDSSVIREAEQVKIDKLVEYLKANPKATVVVTGYADKETGYPAYNLKLSDRRATAVCAAIEKAGIASSRITKEYKGDTVQPFPGTEYYKNRVCICVAEDK